MLVCRCPLQQRQLLKGHGQAKDKMSKSNVCHVFLSPQACTRKAGPDANTTEYTFHVYGRTEGICGLIITDQEYPALVAHQLLSKICDEFLAKYPRSAFATATEMSYPELKDYIVKYQDPQQADSIMKIQKELDETKIVLHKTIESVLERGEKIDNLVQKSDGLSAQSKMFYTQVSDLMSEFHT